MIDCGDTQELRGLQPHSKGFVRHVRLCSEQETRRSGMQVRHFGYLGGVCQRERVCPALRQDSKSCVSGPCIDVPVCDEG